MVTKYMNKKCNKSICWFRRILYRRKKFKELQRFECKTGDIIMSCSGTVGKLFQLPKNSKKES